MQNEKISSISELADILKIKKQKLTYILFVADINDMYTSFDIPKKQPGEFRHIDSPTYELKYIQKSLDKYLRIQLAIIYDNLKINPNLSHGFTKNKNIITNSKIHRNKKIVMNFDIEDFFDSFHFGRVRGYFIKNKNFMYSNSVATAIAKLTCYNGKLPQGAPTSPIITELIMNIFDIRMLKIAKKYKLDYTRYADDLTFSTNDKHFIENYNSFCEELNNFVIKNGFKINDKKTRIMYKNSHQEVTGLTVNKIVNYNRNYYKKTRAMLYSYYKNDYFVVGDVKESNADKLYGRLSFLDYINSKKINKEHNAYNLNSEEKLLQEFLFFKNFIGNDFPLIMCEGKTDYNYLRAALMKFSDLYPQLISKKNSTFNYNIKFFNRTKCIKKWLNLQIDGGDAFVNLLYFYSGNNHKINNYGKKFYDKYGKKSKYPVIILLDNESTNKKPLKKFINEINNQFKSSNFDADHLNKNLYSRIISNLYIMTIPLVNNMSECEIEDLFNQETLGHKIGGKIFSRDVIDNKKQYSKEIFSNYILNNYINIDLENFKPVLTTIVKILDDYNNILNK